MKCSDLKDAIFTVKREPGMDHKKAVCSYVVKACLSVAEHIEDYIPDKVYTDCPGEVVIRLPLDGAATIEVSTETYLLRDK